MGLSISNKDEFSINVNAQRNKCWFDMYAQIGCTLGLAWLLRLEHSLVG